ncbi:MAG: hypothetical protein RR315_06240 [Oscillospiraceae bacterium]
MKKTISLLLVVAMLSSTALTAFGYTEKKIIIGQDKKTGVVLEKGFLTAGDEYLFPVNVSIKGDSSEPLTDEILKDYSFKISNTGKKNSLKEFKSVKVSGNYHLSVEVKAGYPTESTEEEYTLKLSQKAGERKETQITLNFETGAKAVDDSVIDALDKEDVIEVDNKTPVFTKEQLGRIARKNNYKPVNFEGEGWNFKVNITDMPSINLSNDQKPIALIMEKFPENNFEFINFNGDTKFNVNGILEIPVDNISEDYKQKFFVYRYNGEKLLPVAASYNHEEDILSLSSNVLGRFVITDKQIASTVVNGNTNTPDGDTNVTPPTNPSTGAAL